MKKLMITIIVYLFIGTIAFAEEWKKVYNDSIFAIYSVDSVTIWFGTNNGLIVSRLEPNITLTSTLIDSLGKINSIHATKDTIFLGSNHGLYKFTGSKYKLIQNIPSGDNITALGNIADTLIVQSNTDKYSKYFGGIFSTEMPNEIKDIIQFFNFRDLRKRGEHYIPVTDQGTIEVITLTNIKYYDIFYGFPSDNHFSADVSPDEKYIWVGTDAGLVRFDWNQVNPGDVFTPSNQPELTDEKINVVRFDHLGNLWIGTDKGLTVYNKKKIQIPVVNSVENFEQPKRIQLFQNYPNPFNNSTTIQYKLIKTSHVEIRIVNVLGNTVKILTNEIKQLGMHSIIWNANVPSGTYFVHISSSQFTEKIKITLIK